MTIILRTQELQKVFLPDSPLSTILIARLSVLYEDLRIEVLAMSQKSIPILDVTSEDYRRMYFLRRSILTLVEFGEALVLFEQQPDFPDFRRRFEECRDDWDGGTHFFDAHRDFLQRVRNDVGGHFGAPAARYAVQHLPSGLTGTIEEREHPSFKVHLGFAYKIVATSLFRNLDVQKSEEEFDRLLQVVTDGYGHAAKCMHCLVFTYLWPRFG